MLLLLAVVLALGAHMVSLYHLGVNCHMVACIISTGGSSLDRLMALAFGGLVLAILEWSHGRHDDLAQRIKCIQWVGLV